MDLLKLFTLGKRHWLLMALGVLAGLLAVVAVLYSVDNTAKAGSRLIRRSYTTYSVSMQYVVEDAGFWMGRGTPDPNQASDGFDKTVGLAQTYASLAISDAVRHAADASVGPLVGDVVSERVEQAPIISLTLSGKDPVALRRYGLALSQALQTYLTRAQDAHAVPAAQRVTVRLLAAPGRPKAESSREWEMALIAFVAPLVMVTGLALLVDSGKDKV